MNILFISLGCDKNLVDSERMIGMLSARGYEMTDEEELADVMIYCGLMADEMGFDIGKIISDKIDQNDRKYPVDKAFGRKDKYTAYESDENQE